MSNQSFSGGKNNNSHVVVVKKKKFLARKKNISEDVPLEKEKKNDFIKASEQKPVDNFPVSEQIENNKQSTSHEI